MARRRRTSSRASRRFLVPEVLEGRVLYSTVAALTNDNRLLIFDSDAPGAVLANRAVTGLGTGETLLGIDARPATGELYGLATGGMLYTINPDTGAATLKATLTADPADTTSPYTGLRGTDFGIDFNPVPDRLRVVSDANENLRINVDTGRVTTDTDLSYTPGTQHAGEDPTVIDAAYANNTAGATTTTLYDIDSNIGILVTQNPPNEGLLTKVAPFGKTTARAKGFDITPEGEGLVGIEALFPAATQYLIGTIDLTDGTDRNHGRIGDGTVPIRDIAVIWSVEFSAETYATTEGGNVTVTVNRTGGAATPATVELNVLSGSAVQGADFPVTGQLLTFAAGETSKTFTIPVADDLIAEDDEFFVVTLADPTGNVWLGSPATSVVRISANDEFDDVPPRVTKVLLTGPSRGITGFVVHYNEDMDPASAQNVANYTFTTRGRRRTRVALSSATYDPVTRTARVVATQPFMQTDFRELEITVNGKRGGVRDASGNLLDGDENGRAGGNAVARFRVFSGTTVTFNDADGDRGSLTITGGGRIDGITPVKAPRGQRTQFWILDPIPITSTITGTVTRTSTRSNGIIVIAEIIGLDKKEFTPLLTSTSFRINTLTFSSNATGIG